MNGARHAAADGTTGGRHGLADPAAAAAGAAPLSPTRSPSRPAALGGGRPTRRSPNRPAGAGGRASGSGGARSRGRGAVGLPGWLAPPPGAVGAAAVPVGATRVADPDAWRKALVAAIRIEWLAGVACFVGLAYGRTAPYTAGLLAGAIVVAGAYARLRWQGAHSHRPPARDRVPTYAAVAAVAVAVVVVPAAMVGALTLARVAAVAAVTCATFAAMLIGRDAG